MKAEIESLHAETLAFNYMFTCVLRRMAEIDADLAKAIAKGFDDAANSVENLTIRLGKSASPKHTVKAIRKSEPQRSATRTSRATLFNSLGLSPGALRSGILSSFLLAVPRADSAAAVDLFCCPGSGVHKRCIPCKSPVHSRLMPPLNQSLWTLLIASLTAVTGWIIVNLSARIERERQARRTRRGQQN